MCTSPILLLLLGELRLMWEENVVWEVSIGLGLASKARDNHGAQLLYLLCQEKLHLLTFCLLYKMEECAFQQEKTFHGDHKHTSHHHL